MAMKQLNLEEQEQLDQLKAFWSKYGNLISGLLIAVLGSIAAYNAYQWWERDKSAQASNMYDEVERAAKSGDAAKITRSFTDMKERFGGTTYAAQAGLLAAKSLYDKGQATEAKVPLEWVAASAKDESYKAIAKMRLSSILAESKDFDAALKQLDGLPKEFAALAADRRGDILLAQGKRPEAKIEFEKAYQVMEESNEYRRLIAIKLNGLGVDVTTVAATGANAPAAMRADATAAPAVAASPASAPSAAPASAASAAK
jgi:predicted negative regulator of RcsB-dependent stress response